MVDGEQVHAAVAHDCWGGETVQHPLQAGPWRPAFPGSPPGPHAGARAVSCVSQVEQVGPFGVIELQGPGDRIENGGRDAAEGSAFQLGVVLNAYSGKCSNLTAAQAGHATGANLRQTGLLWGEFGSPRDKELTDLGAVVHSDDSTARLACLRCLVSTPFKRDSLGSLVRGFLVDGLNGPASNLGIRAS